MRYEGFDPLRMPTCGWIEVFHSEFISTSNTNTRKDLKKTEYNANDMTDVIKRP